jgi:Fe-S-cluster containining protein
MVQPPFVQPASDRVDSDRDREWTEFKANHPDLHDEIDELRAEVEDDRREWTEFKTNHPDLHAELMAEIERRERTRGPWIPAPCFWLDQQTNRCKHYDLRPRVCREFERGGPECLAWREGGTPLM